MAVRVKLPFFLARGFVAAETMHGALPVLERLSRQGLHTTVDALGEDVTTLERTVAARDVYVQLMQALNSTPSVDNNISIKLSMIGLAISESVCMDNLLPILETARKLDGFVRLDMEGSALLAPTLRIFEAALPEFGRHVGVVLQAYLRRTPDDVARMCHLKARVRLVKGAYKEPARIAFQRLEQVRSNFLECMRMLLSSGTFAAIATHDDVLLSKTRAFAIAENIPPDSFEFQMLYGMRPQTQARLVGAGYGMRVYVPYGDQWFPYYYRRLRERKENALFFLKNALRR